MTLIDAPLVDAAATSATSESEAARVEESRLWRWLAYAGASALGGSPVPTMMSYDDAVASVTVIGSEG